MKYTGKLAQGLVVFLVAFYVTALLVSFGLAQTLPANVGSLYIKTDTGGLDYTCTASIVSGKDLGLAQERVIMTAAHCVDDKISQDGATKQWTATTDFVVTFDEKAYYGAKLLRVGDQSKGYDLALFKFADAEPALPMFRVGKFGDLRLGDSLLNYANPLGLGLQAFSGSLTMVSLQRPIDAGGAKWRGYALVAMPAAPGSSGSLMLNTNQEVVGVLIGVIQGRFGSPFVVVVPQARFADFLKSDELGRPIAP